MIPEPTTPRPPEVAPVSDELRAVRRLTRIGRAVASRAAVRDGPARAGGSLAAGLGPSHGGVSGSSPRCRGRPRHGARRGERPMRSSSSARAASNARRSRTSTGSGIDQCSQSGGTSSSSWARSHTVTTTSAGCRPDSSAAGAGRGGSARAWRRPRRLGRVRRDGSRAVGRLAGALRHRRGQLGRAELWVQMNSARPAGRGDRPETPSGRWRSRM